MPLTIRIHRTIEGVYLVIVRPPGCEPYTHPVLFTEDMINLKIHLVSAGGVGDRTKPVVEAAVIRAAHVQIGQRKLLHHSRRNRVDEVPRRGRKLERSPVQFGIARALIGCQVVERYKAGTHRAAGLGVENTGVWIPQLPLSSRVIAFAGGVESSPTDFSKIPIAHGSAGDARLQSAGLPVPEPFVIGKEKRLVLSDGPTGVGAKLVKATRRQFDAGSSVEPVIGSEHIVAQELKGTSMQRVGPGADDHIDRCGPTKPCGVCTEVGLNLELLHSL